MERNEVLISEDVRKITNTTTDALKMRLSKIHPNEKAETDDRQEIKVERLIELLSCLKLDQTRLTLKDLIMVLHKIFENDRVNIEEIHSLMSSYKSNPAEWLKYAKFDRYRYTRNLVDEGNGKFNLMILCWGEGHGSSIHDHANAHCFMKILAGTLCEIRFEWPKDDQKTEGEISPMKEISRKVLHTDEVCYINDSIGLHRVENLSYSNCSVSLHLYCPPFNACKIFDERTGHSSKSKVTFWSIHGERDKNKTITYPVEDN